MPLLALFLLVAPSQVSEWEQEAASIAEEDAAVEATASSARADASQKLFWAAAAGGIPASLSVVALTAGGTGLVIADSPSAGLVVFAATPLIASAVSVLGVAAVMLLFDRPLPSIAFVSAVTGVAVGFAIAAGGAGGILLGPFLQRGIGLREDVSLVTGASLGMIFAGALSSTLVPAFLASSAIEE